MGFSRSSVFVLLLALAMALPAVGADYDELVRTDILVVGGTPCGIASSIAAARCGSKVIMTEMKDHIGGMMTNGLGKTDIGPRHTIAGIFKEFIDMNYAHYVDTYGPDSEQVRQCSNGYYFEPSVGEKNLNRLLKAEKNVNLRYHYRPVDVLVYGDRIHGVTFLDLKSKRRIQIRAGVVIDTTYEGDIAAMAGVPYRTGRESREEYTEKIGGTLYMDHYTGMVLHGSTGKGDHRLQAYNYRICLTDNPENRAPIKKPANYNRDEYAKDVLDAIEAGRLKHFQDVINVERLPNRKSDTNNMPRALISTDLPEENNDYADGSWERREQIAQRVKEYNLGLLYFLQNDPELPQWLRDQMNEWGLAKDEYPRNDHFPRQLYIREARRIYGLYNFTFHDCTVAPGMERSPIHFDSIACGGYATDSHATRKREPTHETTMEGFYWLGGITVPYQIPYRVIVPQRIDALLVPGAASGTHIGFGTLRMEPVWMAVGQAAGTAAHLARRLQIEPRNVPMSRLQSWLVKNGQIITTFSDVHGPNDQVSEDAWHGIQFFGTRGLSSSYEARPLDVITRGEAAQLLMRSVTIGDFMTAYGPQMRHRGSGSVQHSLTQLANLTLIAAGDPSYPLTEGELAVWLERVAPWIDGAYGDAWLERVQPKETFVKLEEVPASGAEVSRAQFCEELFKKFRSATPANIP